MTLVGIKCPYCDQEISIIIEVSDKQSYECFKCKGKFTAITDIKIIKGHG